MDKVRIRRQNIKSKIKQIDIIIGYYAAHIESISGKIGEKVHHIVVSHGLIKSLRSRMNELISERDLLEDLCFDIDKLSNYVI